MNESRLNILESYIKEIKAADNPKRENKLLVETVRMLLKDIEKLSDEVLADYKEEKEIKHLLGDYDIIAQNICAFFQKSKTVFDVAVENSKVGKSLETSVKELSSVSSQLDELEKNNANLLLKEKELKEKSVLYLEMQEKVSHLKEIDAIKIDLNNKNKELEKEIEKTQSTIKKLESENKKLIESLTALSKTTVKYNDKKSELEENIIEKIKEKYNEIKNIFDAKKINIDEIIKEIEKCKSKHSELIKLKEKYEEEYKTYILHYGENSKIVKKLKEYGISTTEDIQNIDKHINEKLNEYDNIIKEIIIHQEKAKEDIEKLQNKQT